MNRRGFLMGLAAPMVVPSAMLELTNTKLIRPKPLPQGVYYGKLISIDYSDIEARILAMHIETAEGFRVTI